MSPIVYIPEGHSFYTFPVPPVTDSADDDGSAIIDALEQGHNRGAGAHVRQLLDNNETPDEDG